MPSIDKDEVTSSKLQPEDVHWLSSLSESELDFLICLKKLVIQRAKFVGYEGLAVDKCDLKLLRALGYIIIENLKERLKDSSVLSESEVASFINGCNLSNLIQTDKLDPMIIEKICTPIAAKSINKKRKFSETQI